VSYSVFLQRFLHGAATTFDTQTVEALLAPYVTDRQDGVVELSFSDGGSADVYYSSANALMFTRTSPGKPLELLAQVAVRVDGVLLLQDGPVLSTSRWRCRTTPWSSRPGQTSRPSWTTSDNGELPHSPCRWDRLA
jgi:hypothetical protein